jgi:hypothetical protein
MALSLTYIENLLYKPCCCLKIRSNYLNAFIKSRFILLHTQISFSH